MNEAEFRQLVKPDLYQVFLFTSPAVMPFSFARHPWFVINDHGTLSRWEIFLHVEPGCRFRWGHLHKDFYSPLRGVGVFPTPDSRPWRSVRLVGSVSGDEGSLAHRMKEFIEHSPQAYPYCNEYSVLGPNSNTYVQWILSQFPECGLKLPWNSFGKRHRVATSS
jgi:hypothetical protein